MHRPHAASVQRIRRFRRIAVLAAGAAVCLAGCERPSTPPAERARALEERARVMQGLAEASHGASLRTALQSLVKDVAAYNASVGHAGAGVQHAMLNEPGAVFMQSGQPTCALSCPGYPPNPPRGRFCFLDAASYCSPLNGVSFCSYTCIFIYPVFGEGRVRP